MNLIEHKNMDHKSISANLMVCANHTFLKFIKITLAT